MISILMKLILLSLYGSIIVASFIKATEVFICAPSTMGLCVNSHVSRCQLASAPILLLNCCLPSFVDELGSIPFSRNLESSRLISRLSLASFG